MSVKLHPGVDTWDSRLTPLLDDEQKQLIAALAASSYERPYPSHLRNSADDKHLEIDGTNESNKGSRCDDGSNFEELQVLFDLKEPVESLPTLEKWFKGVQESILDEKEIQVLVWWFGITKIWLGIKKTVVGLIEKFKTAVEKGTIIYSKGSRISLIGSKILSASRSTKLIFRAPNTVK